MLTIDLFEEMAVNDLTLIDALRDFLPLAIKHLELPGIPKITLEKSIEKSNVPTPDNPGVNAGSNVTNCFMVYLSYS